MKKVILILTTLLFLTGCGMTDEEKETMLFESLEKAYTALYSADGVGLAVYGEQTLEIDGRNWYLVAISKYDKISKLTTLADEVFTSDLAKEINKTINEKYYESDTGMYSLAEGGCDLGYDLDNELIDELKQDIKIKKYSMNKVTFEYKGKEYTAKKSNNNYVFDEKIFTCENQED